MDRNINPFSGLKFSDKERKQVTEMMFIIYAAVNDEEIVFAPEYVSIPTLDILIKVNKATTMQPFSKRIARAIEYAINKQSLYFTQERIQKSFNYFLLNNGFIKLVDNPTKDNQSSYFATEFGENCGLVNVITRNKQHRLVYSAYMQAYLLRKFPDIFLSAIKAEFNVTYETLENYIEPLTIEEQELIVSYRSLNESGKKYLSDTLDSLFNGVTGGKQKKIS